MVGKKTGKFISLQRKQLSMTQQDLADRLNLTNRAVSKWETGDGCPDISVLPALAEILNVTVDELLKGEKDNSGLKSGSTYCINENKEQAGYLLESSVRQFSNLYPVCLGFILIGIVSSSLGLRLYDGIFLTSLVYALIISLSFLIIGMMFYLNICDHLSGSVKKYNRMVEDAKADFNEIVFKKHILFYAVYLIQAVFCICFIPLRPFMMPGQYRVFKTIFGHTSFGRFVIDQNFCILIYLIAYCILFIAGFLIIKKRFGKQKFNAEQQGTF
ncbi:MAG: helix-turn-helix domain-containing protein [Oscillospiraceae bacterium]